MICKKNVTKFVAMVTFSIPFSLPQLCPLRPVDISQAQSLDGVFLYGCSPASSVVTTPLPPPPPPLPPPPSTNPNISVGLDGQEGSFLAIPLDKEDLVAG